MLKRFSTNERGFTLLELLIAVAIVVIVAGIGVPIYLRFQASAKHSEASQNLNGIKLSEESYKLSNGTYLDCTVHPAVPATTAAWSQTRPWASNANYDDIGFSTSGEVRFVYEVVDSSTTAFVALAHGDTDGDGDTVHFIATQNSTPHVYNGETITATPAVTIDTAGPGDD